ncbi:hypothetical protein JHK87_032554 [Glycine soja]|nr:hypothetical protein JHK87_032554 [Glycine soja]
MATAETKIKGMKIEHPKPKTSLCLCCFGSFHSKTPTTGSEHKAKQKSGSSSWFPWQRIRFRVKNSMAKTVPLEGSEFHEIDKLKLKLKLKDNKVHSSRWKWKSKSKSDLLSKSQSNSTPSQTPSKSQKNRGNNIAGYTRQQSKTSSPGKVVPHAVSLQAWTWKQGKHKQLQNPERYNPVIVAASLVVITLVSMIVWGRLCSIICTTAWPYLIPTLAKLLKTTNRIPLVFQTTWFWIPTWTRIKSSHDVAISL